MEEYKDGQVNYICDKCGRGRMVSFSVIVYWGNDKTVYPSKCQELKCGFTNDLLRKYPQSIKDLLRD